MDGLFHGKPYEQMDDLGVNNPIFGNTDVFFLRKRGGFQQATRRIHPGIQAKKMIVHVHSVENL